MSEPERNNSAYLFREGDWRTHLWLRPDRGWGTYDQITAYALSIDGFAYAAEVWGLRDSLEGSAWNFVMRFEQPDGSWKGGFADLRACLFVLQRAIKWAGGSGPTVTLEARMVRAFEAVCDAWDREHAPEHDR